jgi:phytoene desaturase
VIVGAGPGGLAAAILLARDDLDVVLVERQDHVGGRSAAIARDGFTFDKGPTFFLYPRILGEILAAAGERLSDLVELRRLDPSCRLVFEAGGALDAHSDPAEMAKAIAALEPRDAPGFGRFMKENARKLELFRPVLERPFDRLTDLLAPEVLRALPLLRPHSSVDRDLSRYFSDERIRLAFSFQSKYLGMSPFRCPSLFTILAHLEHGYGVYHPMGGTGALMDGLAQVARRLGVEIRLDEPVEEIVVAGGRTRGVRTAKARIDADAVVLNADFAHAMRHLLPNMSRRRWRDDRLDRKRYSCSTFMLYLGVDGPVNEIPHHTIFLARDYARGLDLIESGREVDAAPSFYVQNASITDPSLAPSGKSALYVLVPVAHQGPHIDWRTQAGAFRTQVLKRLEALGLDGLEQRIVHETIRTPADWEADGIHLGATFNLAHTLGQMLYFRPHNRFEDVPGLYLVGGGTHPGSGLPVIFEGARISARLLLKDLGLACHWAGASAGGAHEALFGTRVPSRPVAMEA